MTFLTVQDLDNFEFLVAHCETHGSQLKLAKTGQFVWRIAIVRPPLEPLAFEDITFGQALQRAADGVREMYTPEDDAEAHDRAVTAALMQPFKGPNTAGLQGVPPEMILEPKGDPVPHAGQQLAAYAKASDRACRGIGDHIDLSDN